MIDVVMPAIAVDRPIVQQTAVAIMLHGEGVAVAVVAVTVIGGAAAHHDIGDIDQHARQRILRLGLRARSEEHTSELQSLMRISYAVFCLKKKTNNHTKLCKQSEHD